MTEVRRQRPNFVLFITDQHRADYLGCYGHPVVRTPNIDSLAARGVCFDRCHVASPVCMPNRSSLMTCRMPSAHGVRSNGIPLSRDAVTFVDLLRDAGYRTALVGKSHLQNFTNWPPLLERQAPRPGYHEPAPALAQARRTRLTGEDYEQEQPSWWAKANAKVRTPYYGFDHVTLVRAHGDAVGGDYDRWLAKRDPDAAKLLGPKNSLPHDYTCPQAYRTAIPAELYSTAFLAESAADYIRAADEEAPFFLMVSFPDPHHPFNPPGKYWDMYSPSEFPVPEAFVRNDWTPPPHVQAVLDQRAAGTADLAGFNSIAITAREAQEAQALTCGMITCIDDAIGAVLHTLRERGRLEDTVLIFTTDHGDHLGDHRLLLKGAEQYQSLVNVPLIWTDPYQSPAAPRTKALVSTIDIGATVLERAMIEPYEGLQGRSMLPAIERGEDVRNRILIQFEHQAPNPASKRPPRVHSIVHGRWRLSAFGGQDWGELYDLENDPGEFENLWASASHAQVRAALIEQLMLAEIEYVDQVPVPTQRA